MKRGPIDFSLFILIERFEKGNQIRGEGLCFRSGAQMHGSVSVARLFDTYAYKCIFINDRDTGVFYPLYKRMVQINRLAWSFITFFDNTDRNFF